ncbi:6-bladed beta-propeller, partial [Capnocytophaga canis]
MKQICFLVCVLLFNSCQNTPEKTRYTQEQIASLQLEETKILTPKMDSIKKIDLNPFLGKKHFEFGNLVSDVKIIPLETNNKSLIGGIYKIITTEEYIYIMDKFKGRNIIIFDKSGKFIKRFSHGQGPGELSRLYDIDYDFKNDELV